MKTTDKKKELQPSSILLLILILYIILYVMFISSKANEADKSLYNTIGNILSLGINAMTIYFVYKSYIFQRKQIEEQKNELEANKQDGEFNRALTIIYQQLEYTNKRYKPVNNPIQLGNYLHYIVKATTEQPNDKLRIFRQHSNNIKSFIKFFNLEFEIYKDVLNVESLSEESKQKLINIITWNIDTRFKSTLTKFRQLYLEWVEEEKPVDDINNTIMKELEKINDFLTAKF